ncbi:hypothetical protein PPL_09270 [Heterostelium album PN500]|uniref:EngB-type G domain-containing protein n=1 Tax=Heterostelium pallidum (strain ATCC 26659 / Pp 5 / PN500) TaxID=670386 RepID=D3BL38_HETP5|nr:hypothetical protein PPL_09270 [Heterostelium album PN500]EFA77772.1 hypothetical protein PPL_09270 [Heterostelium album PN500]|eukprot:XP_020429900.1 hypothetical protein PPL_09270 [Heterostelium album PN500]
MLKLVSNSFNSSRVVGDSIRKCFYFSSSLSHFQVVNTDLKKKKLMKDSYIKLTQSEMIESQRQQKKKREVEKKEIDVEKIMNTQYFVDENSTKNDIEFEAQMKRLMIEQGTEEISSVKIPRELIEQIDFKKRYDPEVLRFADYFFSHQSKLITMAIKSEDFPASPLPQIAFIGRSNVGKSSLLNTLLGDQMAHVSKTPVTINNYNYGCTKSINFYALWDKIMMVDLPGYGYSKVSKDKASVWGRSISEYLLTSHHCKLNLLFEKTRLKKLFLLVDSRVGLQKNDIEVMKLLDEHRVAFQVILTKIDKATTTGLKRFYNQVKEEIMNNVSCVPNIIQCSSKEMKGIQQIRSVILEVTNFDKDNFKNQRNTFIMPEARLPKLPSLPKQNLSSTTKTSKTTKKPTAPSSKNIK